MYARDHALIATPIGAVQLVGLGDRLESLRIGQQHGRQSPTSVIVREAAEQLEQWFAGERRVFDIALIPAATQRGEILRNTIISITYGTTASYGALARQVGSSARAIGQACARNPLPIVVPCHRVLAAGGQLGAYSGGNGPITKQWLLDHERSTLGE